MKLKTKIISSLIITITIVFSLTATLLFFGLKKTFNSESEQKLRAMYLNVLSQKENIQPISLPPAIFVKDTTANLQKPTINKILLQVETENELEEFAVMKGVESINGKHYLIDVKISLVENEDLLATVFIASLIGIILLSLLSLILASKLYDKIMSPFNESIKFLNTFSFKQPAIPSFQETDIAEFKHLQDSIQLFTERILEDLTHLQDFNDMFNHELQTPIAIIQSKLELMMNDGGLNQHLMSLIESSLQSLSRLKSTNKSILMLSRLRQGKSFESTQIDIIPIINTIVSNYEEILSVQNINISTSLKATYFINGNEQLVNVLLSNLLSNAIKYNTFQEIIQITLSDNELQIINSGPILDPMTSAKIFDPFVKSSFNSEGAGLGLAIVKAICNTLNYNISYKYEFEKHIFTLQFFNEYSSRLL